jgi:cyclohexa-1,5-dienecarbonyl-CoA hydratase
MSPVLRQDEPPVVRLVLDRPPLNVIDRALARGIAAAVAEAAADPRTAAIVIEGAGERGFSAGVEIEEHLPGRIDGMLADVHAAVRAVWEAECPTVAAVHGTTLGGGLELALACDVVVAESDAVLGFPEIKLGCFPPVAAALLPRRIGWAAACEIVLGGERLTAERAQALGLVHRICEPGRRRESVAALIAPWLERSPAVVRQAKHALREGRERPGLEALARIERRYLDALMSLDDAHEGIRAYLEKRPPLFRNG